MKKFSLLLCSFLLTTVISAQSWDFEAGVGDWVSGAGGATITVSTDHAVSGTNSIQAVSSTTHGEINIQNDVFKEIHEGDIYTAKMWISSADLALINAVQPFLQSNGWAVWKSGWTAANTLVGDAWNTITWTVPAFDGAVNRVGFQVVKAAAANLVTVYIDDIAVAPAQLITVDASKDAFYDNLTGPSDGYLQLKYFAGNDNGNAYNDADLSAKIWSAWDPQNFYMYVEVTDDVLSHSAANTYQNDGLELKIDPQPTDSVANSIVGPNLTLFGGAASDSLSAVRGAQWARKEVDGGYVLEFSLPWDSIASGTERIHAAADSIFGLAINIHDNDHVVNGTREHSIQWAAVMLDAVWNTPKYLGTVKLLPDNKVDFIPTNNMTGVTNPLPYDGTPFWANVDGKKDPVYTALKGPDDGYLQMKYYAGNDNGNAYSDADLSAKVWSAWDSTWLYMYMEVKDDTLSNSGTTTYNNDGMELKIDPQPTDSVANSIFAPNLTYFSGANSDSLSTVTNTDPEGAKFARRKITGGYALELAMKWADIKSGAETITPAVDNVFGMAINVHDNDKLTGGSRVSSLEWAAVMLDAVWNTPKYLGTVKFLADNKLDYIARNNMTGRTNPLPYNGQAWFINVDGAKDPVYTSFKGPQDGYLQMRSFAGNDNGFAVNDADLSSKLWASWDNEWLYVYEEVKDDTVSGNAANAYQNDCIELKIDPKATDSTQTGGSIFGVNFTALGMKTAGVVSADSLSGVPDSMKQWVRKRNATGYILEFAMKWAAIKTATENVEVGANKVFGLAINNHDNDGHGRQASIEWAAVMRDAVWNTPKYLGTAKFLAGNHFQFNPTNNMTGVTNPIPYDGTTWTGVDEEAPVGTPKEYNLSQNYPNPFNPSTTIQFALPVDSDVRVVLYDILGNVVDVLTDGNFNAGTYKIHYNAAHLASGVYFYRIEAGNGKFVNVKKLLLLK